MRLTNELTCVASSLVNNYNDTETPVRVFVIKVVVSRKLVLNYN